MSINYISVIIFNSKMQKQIQEDTPMVDSAQPPVNPNPSPLEDTSLKQGMLFKMNTFFTKGLSAQPVQQEEQKKEAKPPVSGIPQNQAGAQNIPLQKQMTFGLQRAILQPRNPTLLSNTFRLQKQPTPLVQKPAELPFESKKRTLVDLDNELTYLGVRPARLETIEEQAFDPNETLSPVFKPDIFYDQEQQKLIQKAEVDKKVEAKEPVKAIAGVAKIDSAPTQKEYYIPIIEEEGPQFAYKQAAESLIDDAEVVIKRENELIELREQVFKKEQQESLLEHGFKQLKLKVDSMKLENKRNEMNKLIQQSDLSNKTSFFEIQPNLIYVRDPQGTKLPSKLKLNDEMTTGILIEHDIGYAFSSKSLSLWRISAPETTQINLPNFSSDLLSVNAQTLQNKKNMVFVFTSEELHAFELKADSKPGKEQAFKLDKFDVQSSDRLRYNCLIKTQKKGRLFIGGERGQLSELIIESGPNNKGGFVTKLFNKAKNLLVGGQQQQGSKLKKVDKSLEKANGFLSKLLGGFLYGDKDRLQSKVVIDFAEDHEKNLIFVAIGGASGSVEIYDLGSKGEEFRHALSIPIEAIVEMIEEKVKAKVLFDSSKIEISKISSTNGELTLVMNNGSLIILQVIVNIPPKNKKPDEKLDFIPISIQLLNAVSINLGYILQTFQDLFDDFIPNEVLQDGDGINLWKPITAKPFNFSSQVDPFIPQSQCIVKQCEILGDKAFYLVQDIKSPLSFLVKIEPNYRRGKQYQFTQYLASVASLGNSEDEYGLSFSIGKDQLKRVKAQVLTNTRAYEFAFPTGKDLIYHYLQLLSATDPQKQKQNQQVHERIKADFHMHLQNQDLMTTLEQLFEILLSSRQRLNDKFLISQFAQPYYNHQARLLSQDNQHQHQFMRNHDPQAQLKQGLIHLIQTVAQYRGGFGCIDVSVQAEVQELALEYLISLTTQSAQLETNIISDASYLLAFGAYIRDTSIAYKEKLRIELVFRHIAMILSEHLKTKIFKVNKENALERAGDASMFTIGQLQEKVAKIEQIYQTYRVRLSHESVDLPLIDERFNYQDQFQSLLKLIARVKEGLSIILELEGITQKKELLKDTPKDTKDAIPKLSIEEFITQGTTNNEVCILLELYFSQFDPVNLDRNGSNYLREATKNFISTQAYSLLLGRRYLQLALTLDTEKRENYKQLGYSHLRRHSESVNLPIALEELVKNQMPLQAITLCLEAIDNIEAMRRVSIQEIAQALGHYQVQQNVAIDLTILLLSELYKRLELAEPAKTVEEKEGEFIFQTVFRKQLNPLQRDFLIQLKRRMLQMCIKSTSELFHISLYELLLKQKGGLQELKALKTTFMPRYLDKMNISVDEPKSNEKQKKQLTQQQQIQLFKSKLEASYNHHVGLKLFGEAFSYLVTQLCINQDSKLELPQRIQWLQKAEGCLIRHLEVQPYLSKQQQQLVQLMRKFKDYLLIVMQISQSKKLDENARKVIEQSLVNPEDLLQVALRVKEYGMYMQVIEVNEVREYFTGDEIWGYRERLTNPELTQKKISDMYRHLIENSKAFSPDSKEKKLNKLQSRLTSLNQASLSLTKNSPLDFFPLPLIIRLLHSHSLTLLKQLSNTYISLIKHFWYLELLIKLGANIETIYTAVAPSKELIAPQQQAEDYFAIAYLAKYHPQPELLGSIMPLHNLTAKQVIQDAIDNELMYAPSFIAACRELMSKTDLVSRARMIPQQ